MRNATTIALVLMASLLAICSVDAYIYYVEAENFDLDNSEPVMGGAIWQVVQNKDAFNGQYMQYTGPHAGATTSLLYPLPNVGTNTGRWQVWVRCVMPDGGSDSYFFYVSTDGGEEWGFQQAAHGGGAQGPDWKWESWTLTSPFEKGGDNVLKISERENAKADLICIRDDGLVPSEEEYEKWQEEHKEGQIAVEPIHKIATTWGKIKHEGL